MNQQKNSTSILSQVLTELKKSGQQGVQPIAVFDLDSTLFDVTPRLQRILHNFAHDPEYTRRFPENALKLRQAEAHPKDWGIKHAMERAGVDGRHPEFEIAIKDFWLTSFFSNEYLHYDEPYPGAVQFVKDVAATGAQIVYLTGRDIPRMQKGTVETLIKWDFPMNETQCQVVLKPRADMDDAKFKSDFFASYAKKLHSHIWLFENEPVNVNLVRKNHPEIQMVFIDTVHAGKEPIPHDLPQIMHYLFDK